MKNLNKKNSLRILLIVAIVITLVTGLGTTYAFFVYRGNGSNVSVETGDVKVTFTNNNNYLTTGNSYPISDNTGKTLPYYSDFTIDATTQDMGLKYEIQTITDSGNNISPEYIKVYLTDQADNPITDVLTYSDLTKAEYNTTAELVYTDYITETGTLDFRLRIWIDENYNLQDGQTFGVTINLYAVNGKPNYLVDTVVNSYGTNGLVAVATDGTLYTDSSTQTIREYRYSGSNDVVTNNYVSFNGDLWRIIGVFPTEIDTGTTENLIKIIKATPLTASEIPTTYTYNGVSMTLKDSDSDSTVYWNKSLYFGQTNHSDWTQASLQYFLNDETSGSASYYNSIDSTYQSMIQKSVYHLGNWVHVTNPKVAYEEERSETVWDGNQTTWTGNIGLMYPSDYGYAADSTHWDTSLGYGGYNEIAADSDWLFDSNSRWTISPTGGDYNMVVYVSSRGEVSDDSVESNYTASPVLYLKSDVKILGGTGLEGDAYRLG